MEEERSKGSSTGERGGGRVGCVERREGENRRNPHSEKAGPQNWEIEMPNQMDVGEWVDVDNCRTR